MDELLSLKQAAKVLGCSEALLRKWMHLGRLPSVKIGRLIRVRQSDVEAWLRLGLRAPGPSERAR
jgi:excisionase family DNA binding protein